MRKTMVKITKTYKHKKYDVSLGDSCIYESKEKKVYGIHKDYILINGYNDSYLAADDPQCLGHVLPEAVEKGYSKWVNIEDIFIIQ